MYQLEHYQWCESGYTLGSPITWLALWRAFLLLNTRSGVSTSLLLLSSGVITVLNQRRRVLPVVSSE